MPDNLRRSLGGIVNDLWGTPVAAKPAPQPLQTESAAFPPFEQLWKTADDTVDWTDALAHDKPTDGLTSQNLWTFFHQHAEKVLQGDTAAYVEVLQAANPLGDLAPYAQSFDVETLNADQLQVNFQAKEAYLGKSDEETRRYLCAVSLRIARDLMALLPVREITVLAQQEDVTLLNVAFDRSELQKVRFSFIDPVAFVTACGGSFVK